MDATDAQNVLELYLFLTTSLTLFLFFRTDIVKTDLRATT